MQDFFFNSSKDTKMLLLYPGKYKANFARVCLKVFEHLVVEITIII